MKTEPHDVINAAFDRDGGYTFGGLTKRELFAVLAMQGILGNAHMREDLQIVAKSIQLADELIAKLNKTGTS